jgi:hypothetical protein
MSDLVEWLLTCIAEDEAEALEWRRRCSPSLPTLADPARVLAVCKAHRQIVERFVAAEANNYSQFISGDASSDPDMAAGIDLALEFACHALATIYVDRPGCREEWTA